MKHRIRVRNTHTVRERASQTGRRNLDVSKSASRTHSEFPMRRVVWRHKTMRNLFGFCIYVDWRWFWARNVGIFITIQFLKRLFLLVLVDQIKRIYVILRSRYNFVQIGYQIFNAIDWSGADRVVFGLWNTIDASGSRCLADTAQLKILVTIAVGLCALTTCESCWRWFVYLIEFGTYENIKSSYRIKLL